MAVTALLESLWLSPLGQSPHKTVTGKRPLKALHPSWWKETRAVVGRSMTADTGQARRGRCKPKGISTPRGSDTEDARLPPPPGHLHRWAGAAPASTPLTRLGLLFTAVLPRLEQGLAVHFTVISSAYKNTGWEKPGYQENPLPA